MIRTEVVPAVDFPLVVHGEGVLERQGTRVPVTNLSAERLKYRTDRPWSITLRIGRASSDELHTVLYGRNPLPMFRGHSSPDRPFVIPSFEYRSWRDNQVVGEAFEISSGLSDAPVIPSELVLTAYLSDNSVAVTLRDFLLPRRDGTVSGGKKRKPQTIRSPLGTIKLWKTPLTERVEVGGAAAHVGRSQTIAQVVVPPSRRRKDLITVLDELNAEIDQVTPILSLFSRQRVGCYRLAVWASWTEGSAGFIEGERWLRGPGPEDRLEADRLINPLKIPSGGLNVVATRFRNHPSNEQLRRAITYTVGTHGQGIIEHHALYAYTALECLVNALHTERLSLAEPAFTQLEKHLKAAIKNSSDALSLSKSQRRDLYGKLRELQRRPIVSRIIELVESRDVKWDDLWPSGTLAGRLRNAYNRRNDLFHEGHLRNPTQTIRDSMRIAALAERLLLAELAVPSDWTSPFAYDVFKGMQEDQSPG